MSKKDGKVSIYALCDENGVERYVGQTVHRLAARLSGHWCARRKSNTDLQAWLDDLRARGLRPTIKLLEVVDAREARAAETRHILLRRAAGLSLLNHALGQTPAWLAYATDEERQRYLGATYPQRVPLDQLAPAVLPAVLTPAQFGVRLRALRQRRLLSQAELAALIGADQRQISWWEKGRAMPRAARRRQLCAILGVSPDELEST